MADSMDGVAHLCRPNKVQVKRGLSFVLKSSIFISQHGQKGDFLLFDLAKIKIMSFSLDITFGNGKESESESFFVTFRYWHVNITFQIVGIKTERQTDRVMLARKK